MNTGKSGFIDARTTVKERTLQRRVKKGFGYGADMLALIITFSLWAFGVHAFLVFKWFHGQKALKDLNEPGVSTF
jgi:hypothetical protein